MIYVYELEGGVVQIYTAGQLYTLTIVAGYTVLPVNTRPTATSATTTGTGLYNYGYEYA